MVFTAFFSFNISFNSFLFSSEAKFSCTFARLSLGFPVLLRLTFMLLSAIFIEHRSLLDGFLTVADWIRIYSFYWVFIEGCAISLTYHSLHTSLSSSPALWAGSSLPPPSVLICFRFRPFLVFIASSFSVDRFSSVFRCFFLFCFHLFLPPVPCPFSLLSPSCLCARPGMSGIH